MTALDSQQQVERRQLQLAQRLSALEGQCSAAASFDFQYLQALLRRCPANNPAVARRLLDRVEAGIAALGKPGDDSVSAGESSPVSRSRLALAQLRRDLDGGDEPLVDSRPQRLADELGVQDQGDQSAGRSGLRAAKNLGAIKAQFQLDQLMATALLDQPEAPGPLNPQGLMIRALATMRNISPAYLSRFVNYSRTLLWLQRAADKAEQGKPAKGKG